MYDKNRFVDKMNVLTYAWVTFGAARDDVYYQNANLMIVVVQNS